MEARIILSRSFEYVQENCTTWNTTGSNGTSLCSGSTKGDALSDEAEAVHQWQVVFFGILAAYMSLLTIVGNLIVILSFIIERSIRQTSNYFIASLAVSDLLIGCVSMPLYTVYLLSGQHWPLGEVLCDLWLSLDYTVCLCSIYTVFCITIDRYCSVTIPAKYYKWRTERKVLLVVTVTWIVPVIVFFTSIIGWQYFVHQRTVPSGKCYVQYMENALFNCLLQVGYFWVTLFVMCALYAGIYRVALRLHRKSETRRKKMTSLVSMAGETITKIGIGVTGQQKRQEAAAAAAATDAAAAIGMQMLQVPKGQADCSCQEGYRTTRCLGLSDGTYLGMVGNDDWPTVKGHELSEGLEQRENSPTVVKGMAPGLVLENHVGEDSTPQRMISSSDNIGGVKDMAKLLSPSIRHKSTVKRNSPSLGLVPSTTARQSSPNQGVYRRIRISMNELQKDIGNTRNRQIGNTFREKTGVSRQLDEGTTKCVNRKDTSSGQQRNGGNNRVGKKIRFGGRNWSWMEDRMSSVESAIPFLDEDAGNVKSGEELLRGEEDLEEDCSIVMANRLHRPTSICIMGDHTKADEGVEDQSSKGGILADHREEKTTLPLDDASLKRSKENDKMRSSLPSQIIRLSVVSDATTRPHEPSSDVDECLDCRKTKPTQATTTTTTTTPTTTAGGDKIAASPTAQDSSLFFSNYPAQTTSCESDCCPEQTSLLAPPSSSTGPSSCDAASFCSAIGVSSILPDSERRRKSRFVASRKWSSRKRAEKRRELGRLGCGGGAAGDGDGTGEEAEERFQGQQQQHQSRHKHENRAMKSLRTITLILGAFVVCWTPWHILSLIIGFCPDSAVCVPPILYDISYWLCYINSPLNPFCYAFANQQFKKTFVRILRLDWHKT